MKYLYEKKQFKILFLLTILLITTTPILASLVKSSSIKGNIVSTATLDITLTLTDNYVLNIKNTGTLPAKVRAIKTVKSGNCENINNPFNNSDILPVTSLEPEEYITRTLDINFIEEIDTECSVEIFVEAKQKDVPKGFIIIKSITLEIEQLFPKKKDYIEEISGVKSFPTPDDVILLETDSNNQIVQNEPQSLSLIP